MPICTWNVHLMPFLRIVAANGAANTQLSLSQFPCTLSFPGTLQPSSRLKIMITGFFCVWGGGVRSCTAGTL